MFGSLGLPEILLILVIALLVFGPKRLPEVGRTIGKGLGEFRRASADLKRTVNAELALDEDERPRSPRRPEPPAAPAPSAAPPEGVAAREPAEPGPELPPAAGAGSGEAGTAAPGEEGAAADDSTEQAETSEPVTTH